MGASELAEVKTVRPIQENQIQQSKIPYLRLLLKLSGSRGEELRRCGRARQYKQNRARASRTIESSDLPGNRDETRRSSLVDQLDVTFDGRE